MESIPWNLLGIIFVGLILVVLGITFYFIKKNKKDIKIDYKTLFIIGITWLAVGLPFENYALSAMGGVFLVVGIANKDKWEENEKKWGNLSDEEKKTKITLIVVLSILVLVGLVLYLLQG